MESNIFVTDYRHVTPSLLSFHADSEILSKMVVAATMSGSYHSQINQLGQSTGRSCHMKIPSLFHTLLISHHENNTKMYRLDNEWTVEMCNPCNVLGG